MFNAARISKLPGTLTRKGLHSDERPCRYARVLDWGVSGQLDTATLEEWASYAQSQELLQAPAQIDTSWQCATDAKERARLWIAKRDPAIEGQNGDEWTFKTAATLVKGFSLSDGDALDLLGDWNRRCSPPWTLDELQDKLANARKYSDVPDGAMLSVRPPRSKSPVEQGEMLLLDRAILAIGGECDGTAERDGVGFNSRDADFFAMHLDAIRKGQPIPQKFRAKSLDRLSKYGGQLLQLGFNTFEISAEEDSRKAALKEQSESELTQVEILLELVEGWQLIRWQGQFYASFLVENQGERAGTYRRETHRFSRSGVRAQLYYAFKKREGYPPNSEAIASVVMSLESDAQFEGQDREVFIRTAHHEGKFYIDLQDGFGTAVCISETGWELTNDPPVLIHSPERVRQSSVSREGRFVGGLSKAPWA